VIGQRRHRESVLVAFSLCGAYACSAAVSIVVNSTISYFRSIVSLTNFLSSRNSTPSQ
jgi:hypothetical protein